MAVLLVIVVVLLALNIIACVGATVILCTHKQADLSDIRHDVKHICGTMAGLDFLCKRIDARLEVQRYEGEMIRRMFTEGVHLRTDPATKPLTDAEVKKIMSEARLTFVKEA